MCNKIAALSQKIEGLIKQAEMEEKQKLESRQLKLQQQKADGVEGKYEETAEYDNELVFEPWFRKGPKGIEVERLRKLKLQQEMQGQPVVDDYSQGETDWDVEAVEDEDQL